jgi:hypothetical protein
LTSTPQKLFKGEKLFKAPYLQLAVIPLGTLFIKGKGEQNKELMSSQYIANYIKEQECEAASEREWREREGEEIPSWMDEEVLTARAYESQGL